MVTAVRPVLPMHRNARRVIGSIETRWRRTGDTLKTNVVQPATIRRTVGGGSVSSLATIDCCLGSSVIVAGGGAKEDKGQHEDASPLSGMTLHSPTSSSKQPPKLS
jgi:hypothetical protein